jgi:hypothetical protein
MSKEKTVVPTNNDTFDFGFSFADENEVAGPQTSSVEEVYKKKLLDLENMILPLLNNLMKNPDKPFIKWENRVPVIEAQIEKIKALTRG